ncbi:MAG TPA: DUF4476 domain-containing protein [Chitinophagaceae bacterium]|nr:DUF4476 domain-containing protein [Chitinophagaceae bacterium]
MILILIIGGRLPSLAQDNHFFIYLQSDGQQLFYVKINGKLLSSSPAGYLIIPGMKPGKNLLVVGFPKNEYPEQHFSVDMDGKKDKGFLLKKSGHRRFVLYDLTDFQKLDGLAAQNPSGIGVTGDEKMTSQPEQSRPGKDTLPSSRGNPFRDMLAAVTHQNLSPNDTGSANFPAETPVHPALAAKSSGSIPDRALAASKQRGTRKLPNVDSLTAVKPDTTQNGSVRELTAMEISGHSVPKTNLIADTGQSEQVQASASIPENSPFPDSLGESSEPQPTQTAKPHFIDFSSTVSGKQPGEKTRANPEGSGSTPNSGNQKIPVPASLENSDCHNQASDQKFIKVRLKIALRNTPDKMMATASKFFNEDCYSVDQIQSLALLFNSDKYRYRLLEMAYAHAYDSGHYYRLEHILTDVNYREKFMAMLKK